MAAKSKRIPRSILKKSRSESNYERAELAKKVGERFKEARELVPMTQIDAAEQLGFSNSSQLAKIEGGYSGTVQFYTIWKAAQLYDVSVDFLSGLSDDWERDPVVYQERKIGKWLHERAVRAAAKEINNTRILGNRLAVVERAVSFGLSGIMQLKSVIDDFAAKNEGFDDMRLGAKLLRVAAETTEQMVGVSAELKRYQAFHDVAKKEPVNLDVFRDLGE